MEILISTAGLITVAAITPGPNNLVVMLTAARAGWNRTPAAILGIVLGSLTLLAVAVAGTDSVYDARPHLQVAITIAGCLYLGWIGLQLVRGSDRAGETRAPPTGALQLFAFQFLNPKGWIMVLTAVAAAHSSAGAAATFSRLALLFTLIPAICLVAWALLGTLISRYLDDSRRRARFDRVMGGLLMASALLVAAAP